MYFLNDVLTVRVSRGSLLVLFMEVSFLAISGEEAFRNTDH